MDRIELEARFVARAFNNDFTRVRVRGPTVPGGVEASVCGPTVPAGSLDVPFEKERPNSLWDELLIDAFENIALELPDLPRGYRLPRRILRVRALP